MKEKGRMKGENQGKRRERRVLFQKKEDGRMEGKRMRRRKNEKINNLERRKKGKKRE